jgi:putative endonuclease
MQRFPNWESPPGEFLDPETKSLAEAPGLNPKSCPSASEKMMKTAMPREAKTYYVYIMTNRSLELYVGVTSKLEQLGQRRKDGSVERPASRHYFDRLVYFERWAHPGSAIRRGREIKSWRRLRKIQLIVAENPEWKDLSEVSGKRILRWRTESKPTK